MTSNIRTAFSKFVSFTDNEWSEISQYLFTKNYSKGDFFNRGGDICNHAGFIDKGLFSYYYLIDGVQHTRQFFFVNNFISNYTSFISEKKSQAFIQALEDSSVTLIHKNHLNQVYKKLPKFQELGRGIAEHLFLIVSEKYESFLLESPEERYLNLIKERPKVIQNIPQYMIASYLGITPEGLSRIRKRLSKM